MGKDNSIMKLRIKIIDKVKMDKSTSRPSLISLKQILVDIRELLMLTMMMMRRKRRMKSKKNN